MSISYFQGRRDLFEGLRIMDMEDEWEQYPVMVFDFNSIDWSVENSLRKYVGSVLLKGEQQYGVTPVVTDDFAQRFRNLLEGIHSNTDKQVVVLIDEYDKPLLDLLETGNDSDEQLLRDNRNFLKSLFSTFKAADEHLRFVLLTGVTKFSQVSMFSGFNQPDDISIDTRFETLCGITEKELHSVFAESIRELADSEGISEDEAKAWLKDMYDGYHFSRKMTDIYNPFSIINAFAKNNVQSYWFRSGTPSFLMRLLANTQEEVMRYTGQRYKEQMFVDYKADREMPLPMIFQSGYLTIKEVDTRFGTYLLDCPVVTLRRGS